MRGWAVPKYRWTMYAAPTPPTTWGVFDFELPCSQLNSPMTYRVSYFILARDRLSARHSGKSIGRRMRPRVVSPRPLWCPIRQPVTLVSMRAVARVPLWGQFGGSVCCVLQCWLGVIESQNVDMVVVFNCCVDAGEFQQWQSMYRWTFPFPNRVKPHRFQHRRSNRPFWMAIFMAKSVAFG
jgi:hypothetical protein